MSPSRFQPSASPPPRERTHEAVWFAFAGSQMIAAERAEPGAPFPLAAPVARDLADLGLAPVRTQYLGTLDGRPCFAAELPDDADAPAGHRLMDLRRLHGRLDPVEYEVAGTAFQIQYWDRGHQFCPACAT